jgi:hypothetical protein
MARLGAAAALWLLLAATVRAQVTAASEQRLSVCRWAQHAASRPL